MSDLRYCIVVAVCMMGLTSKGGLCFAASVGEHPGWKVGDQWTVRTWYAVGMIPGDKRPPIYVRKGAEVLVSFSVSMIKEIEGQSCYEVRVVYPPDETGFQDRYLLYYRTDTFKLVRVVNNSLRTDGSVVDSVERFRIDENGPTIVSGSYQSAVPFSFPDLNCGDTERTDADKYAHRQVVTTRVAKDADGGEHTEREFVLAYSKNNYERKTVLTWVDGEPWWRHAIKYRDISSERKGEIAGEAELVEFTTDGTRRVIKPKQDEE
ncbi:MAG: hypothetical protein WBE26_12935 [Phycisphaerae bacterium]